ncbi:major head protein [uncultured Mediterranean phage uvMED]|nr:major head protein [uncultured Mediterranean phage uvMED]
MANNLGSNITENLIESFAPAFESQRLKSKTISSSLRNLVTGFDDSTGGARGAVRQKKPPQFVPQRTDDGDFTGKDKNPIKVGSVPAEVGQYCTVFMEYTDVEVALEAKGVQLEELVTNAAIDMVNDLELELGKRMYRDAALMVGDPTQPVTKWEDVAPAGTLLKSIGLPSGKIFAELSNHQATDLASEQKGLAVNPEAGSAWADATIASRFAGIDSVYQSDSCHVFETGTSDGTGLTVKTQPVQTYSALKDDTRMTVVITGGTEDETLTAGTPITIDDVALVHFRNRQPIIGSGNAHVKMTLSLVEDVTFDASGDATCTLSGTSVFETGIEGAFNTANTLILAGATVTVGVPVSTPIQGALAYHQSYYGMGSIQLKKLKATDSRFDTNDGMSIRVTEVGDATANKHQLRLDVRPTFACLNGFAACKIFGQV